MHMGAKQNLCTSSMKRTHYPLFRNLSLYVFFSLPHPLSFQTENSNWVLRGLKLPWALCCGCLIGCVIHKWIMLYCTVSVVEAFEKCLSSSPREQMEKFILTIYFLVNACVSRNCALYSAFILIIFILVNMITVSCTFSLALPLKKICLLIYLSLNRYLHINVDNL